MDGIGRVEAPSDGQSGRRSKFAIKVLCRQTAKDTWRLAAVCAIAALKTQGSLHPAGQDLSFTPLLLGQS